MTARRDDRCAECGHPSMQHRAGTGHCYECPAENQCTKFVRRLDVVEEANALAATYRELNELSDVIAKLARVFDLPPVALASTVTVADEGTLLRLLHQRLTEIRARDGL